MDNLYIEETEKFSSFYLFLFLKLNIKKFFKKKIKKGDIFNILYVPSLKNFNKKKKEIFIKKFIKFIEAQRIKNICTGKINEDLKKALNKNFHIPTGEVIFYEKFNEILEFFAKKKGINLSLNEICFLSNNPDIVKKLILKCKNKVKMFSVLTDNIKEFNKLKEEISEETGIYIRLNENKKKINTIYINCEKNKLNLKEMFIKANTIDIFRVYKNTYYNVKLFYKTTIDEFLNFNNIEKSIIFSDFFINCLKTLEKTELLKDFLKNSKFKVVNIKKYD